jgi:8-oxo-dGTP pyrophosphatase MutT (NUDIX family)
MRLDEIQLRQKAGIIPYYMDNKGIPLMLFMTPSNPQFGGPLFQIAKGKIESGENIQEAALREAEELGLIQSNIKHLAKVTSSIITGLDDTYNLTIFAAEIIDPKNFKATEYETGKRAWLNVAQFSSTGRQNQLNLVRQTTNFIHSRLSWPS